MHIRPTISLLLLATVLLGTAGEVRAQDRFRLDLENGAVISGRNDVRIPGDSGTLFSLTDDLTSDTAYFWRVRADVRVGRKHVLSALVAPLRLQAAGRFDRPVLFEGETFAAGIPVSGLYVFNSYRVTYRYEPVQGDAWRFGFGVTGKIRDAVTRLESGGTVAEKSNVGFVPLVNFKLERRLGERASVLLEGDALAAPQGRAEDVFAGVVVDASRRLSFKAGYRVLEGGADTDEVFTFALVHYLAAGAVFRF
ncbi:MAG TPA: hypothetical protein VMW48_07805 [Vicinamibacterales bacterium]|nr:hypothetical protein [Vicinamibacterales bacterium]